MQREPVIRGVPRALANDAWWLGQDPPAPPAAAASGDLGGAGHAPGVAGLLALVVCADLLFWRETPGVSLALFAVALYAVATIAVAPGRGGLRPAMLLLSGALPVVEFVQPLSVAFLGAALLGALAMARMPPEADAADRLRAALGLAASLPPRWAALALGPLRSLPRIGLPFGDRLAPRARRTFGNWAFPVGGTLVFATLLVDANPLLSELLARSLDPGALARRCLFWAGIALLIRPLLDAVPPPLPMPAAPRLPGLGINPGSVLRALWLFNLLIGVQTVLDASILVGGASLPEGMSFAAYAHRGAYPLLATTLLAGAFALAARPFLGERRSLGPLMLIWLAQNVALCGSAFFRLRLYIDAYGLTHLRIHALIWMALVAAGLALTGWQVARGRSSLWLLRRAGGLAFATLYAASFVNFAGIIAEKNLTLPRVDMAYICTLGPMAAGALARSGATRPSIAAEARRRGCSVQPDRGGWQSWGFRKWRVGREVAAAGERTVPGGRRLSPGGGGGGRDLP